MRLESVTSEVWQDHCGRCRRSSLYQDARWLTLIEVVYPRLPVHRLACLASDGKPAWLLPVVELKPLFERSPMLISLPFGNYGGFLLPLEDPSPVTGERLEPLRAFFESSRAFALEIRQLDAPPDGLETHDAFCRFELELPDDPEILWHRQLTGNTRNMVRKAEKLGVEAVFDADDAVGEFQRIYERASSHFGTPIHHLRWYETLREMFPGETRILLGRLEGRFVAGLFVLEDGDRILVHAALTDPTHRRIPVQDLLYWSLMRRVIEERGHATLDFGRTRRDEAKRFFKRRWGGVEKPIFYSYLLKPGRRPPEILPENPKLAPAVRLWRLIPRPLQRWIGPHLRVRIPT